MCVYLEVFETFFEGNLSWSCIMLFKRFSVPWESKFYLKAFLHLLILPFTETVTKLVKREMCLNLDIVNNFFCKKLLLILHNIFLKGFQCHESQYLPGGSFTPLDSPFFLLLMSLSCVCQYFFLKNLFWLKSCYLKGSQSYENQYLIKDLFT